AGRVAERVDPRVVDQFEEQLLEVRCGHGRSPCSGGKEKLAPAGRTPATSCKQARKCVERATDNASLRHRPPRARQPAVPRRRRPDQANRLAFLALLAAVTPYRCTAKSREKHGMVSF